MKLLQFLQSSNGDYSSKRLYAITCMVVAIILAFKGADWNVIYGFLGSASLVFIGQAYTKT